MNLTEALEILIECATYVNEQADPYDVVFRMKDNIYTYDGAERAIEIVKEFAKENNLPNRHRL
tara:strand:- start:953 stop:1141 length:189 start_codon:yes stop_codon:yes gene_type:complete